MLSGVSIIAFLTPSNFGLFFMLACTFFVLQLWRYLMPTSTHFVSRLFSLSLVYSFRLGPREQACGEQVVEMHEFTEPLTQSQSTPLAARLERLVLSRVSSANDVRRTWMTRVECQQWFCIGFALPLTFFASFLGSSEFLPFPFSCALNSYLCAFVACFVLMF
jgi:hypothetical protein